MNDMADVVLTPDQRVSQAVTLTAQFEAAMRDLEAKRKQIVDQAIADAEHHAIDHFRDWIQNLFAQKGAKT